MYTVFERSVLSQTYCCIVHINKQQQGKVGPTPVLAICPVDKLLLSDLHSTVESCGGCYYY